MQTRQALALMLTICGAGIVVDALERLAGIRKYSDGGMYSWTILRQRFVAFHSAWRRWADPLFHGSARLAVVLLIRLAAVALMIYCPVYSAGYSIALTAVVLSHVYLGIRTAGFGTTGADPMTLAITGAAWMTTVLTDSPVAARTGLWFVAAQACLAYVVAGVAKLRAPSWRSGAAMTAVMSTHTYGSAMFHRTLLARPRLSQALCWSVMLWETAFPLALVVPHFLMWALLLSGFLFHASLAALMGINLFLFAFPAAYVAIWAVRF